MSHFDFTSLDARARGLSTHLLARAELERLATCGDPAALTRELARASPELPARPSVAELDRALRRTTATLLRRLARWSTPPGALEVHEAAQDRRSLRALLRGAQQGASPESRLGGLLSTSSLPERALSELARQPTPAKVAAHLFALGHPDGPALTNLTAGAQVVLFELELELTRGFAERATHAARRGDPNLRAFVRTRVDLCNLELALMLAGEAHEADPAHCFVEGGEHVTLAIATEAASATSRDAAVLALQRALAATPLAELVAEARSDPARLERAALLQALRTQRALSLRDPLGSAPLLLFLLRLEAQQLDLHRIAWAIALGAPAASTLEGLVTPWR